MKRSVEHFLFTGLTIGAGFLLVRTCFQDSAPEERIDIVAGNVPPKQEAQTLRLPAAPQAVVEPKPQHENNDVGKTNSNEVSVTTPKSLEKKERKALTKERLVALKQSQEFDDFLTDALQDNLAESVKSEELMENPGFADPNLNGVKGQFVGKVKFTEDPNKSWEMTMNVDFQVEGSKMRSAVYIFLTENGKTIEGFGDLSSGVRNFGDGLGVIVNSSQRDDFQLFYIPSLDAFIGNYYEHVSISPEQFLPRGTVRLYRSKYR